MLIKLLIGMKGLASWLVTDIKGQTLIKPSRLHPLRCYKFKDNFGQLGKLASILH